MNCHINQVITETVVPVEMPIQGKGSIRNNSMFIKTSIFKIVVKEMFRCTYPGRFKYVVDIIKKERCIKSVKIEDYPDYDYYADVYQVKFMR